MLRKYNILKIIERFTIYFILNVGFIYFLLNKTLDNSSNVLLKICITKVL